MGFCVCLNSRIVSKSVLTALAAFAVASPAMAAKTSASKSAPKTAAESAVKRSLTQAASVPVVADPFAAPIPSPSSSTEVEFVPVKKKRLSSIQRETRIKHARELFGKRYSKSIATTGEDIKKINGRIYRWTKEKLPKKYRSQYQKVAQTIIDESLKYEFDPVFLMSVIEGESSFRPDKVGGVGEIGLMQIRPSTAEWIAKREGLKWEGDKSLYDPSTNIRIGATYLSYLRDHFDSHARLYLAAYNMGQTNVANALDRNIWPKDYPIHVMKRYVQYYETMAESLAEKRKPAAKLSKG